MGEAVEGNTVRRPMIGVTSYGRDEKRRFRVAVDYIDALRRAGAIPIVLPPGEPDIEPVLDLIDGLLLTGGGDVAPARYGGSDHPKVYGVDEERDQSELAWIEAVLERGMPSLAICRGAQLLNVALGGSLVAHLPDHFDGSVIHRLELEGGESSHIMHPVLVEPESRLAGILGQLEVDVASWHHQSIDRLAGGLRVSARSADGLREAFEPIEGDWPIALQWHPEITAARDPAQQRIFEELTAAAWRWATAAASTGSF